MPLTPEQVYQLNANEARKRELRVKIARIAGQLDASAAVAGLMARLNQDTRAEKEELEAELRRLEAEGATGITDDWGRFSKVDMAAFAERYYAKDRGYDWLEAHRGATWEEAVAKLEELMLEYRVGMGRPWLLQRAEGLLREWQANARAAGRFSGETWEAFRDWLLSIGKAEAVHLAG